MNNIWFSEPLVARFHWVSEDGLKLLTKYNNSHEIRTIPLMNVVHSFEDISCSICFSPDSKYLAYSSESFFKILNLDDLDTFYLKLNSKVIKVLWNKRSSAVVFISDLELFTGVCDIINHKNFKLKGCSLDTLGKPLCSFSPNDDYFCTISSQKLHVYCAKLWTLKIIINCYGVSMLKFISPYVVFVAMNESYRAISVLSASKLIDKDCLPDHCVKDIAVSEKHLLACIASYSNSLIIYETVSFKQLILISCKFKLQISNAVNIWEEKHNRMCLKWIFNLDNLDFYIVKNFSDEHHAKNKKFITSFSHDGKFIAAYNPGIPDFVSIWSWSEDSPLKSIILVNNTEIKGLKWAKQNVLAIVGNNKIFFWHETSCTNIVLNDEVQFNWVNKGKCICTIGNNNIVQLVSVILKPI
ncbi:uncharacterized protein LOC106666413 isoform X2 [Cimex lectularius]|uniref:Uncharacterized protein n=1 Tax=Cimex lectularius TaxID=79782 RepID=A0A8I6SIP7_CIMLE|nr:uncharacterized protein LOC106666413 isoform X2 [Cimex lectularius]